GQSIGADSATSGYIFNGPGDNIRISGTQFGLGVGIRGTGTNPSTVGTTLQNNSMYLQGDFAGGLTQSIQRTNLVTLNDTAANPTAVPMNFELRNISSQSTSLNSSGTFAFIGGVPTAAGTAGVGVFQAGSLTTTGNTGFIGIKTATGAVQVIAQGGQAAPGGGTFGNGTTGLNGFNIKLNQNGQAYFDSRLVNSGLVTTANDNRQYIWTPGSGTVMVQREGQSAPDSGGSQFSGQPSPGGRGFSNAGVLYTSTLSGGDVTTADPATRNDFGLYISTTTATTKVVRRNDIVPGFTAGDNVRFGNVTSGFGMNNNGQTLFAASLQGAGVITSVAPSYAVAGTPPRPVSVITPGVQGNSGAIFTGAAGSLQMIARTGDLLPYGNGLRFDLILGGSGFVQNNNNDILFNTDTTYYAPGDAIGVAGAPAESVLPAGPRVLMSWTAAYGLVPLLHAGQTIEVDPGVFKSILTWNISTQDDGNGGTLGMNDAGVITAYITFNEGGWGVVKLQIPAPSTGILALLGVGAMARRRRR
ncbi:MAG: hypothetical protein K2W85_17420, partial [Phycisphaerales bacterium]|nr:hypothetical protein [Phycisphaerales bacterium]